MQMIVYLHEFGKYKNTCDECCAYCPNWECNERCIFVQNLDCSVCLEDNKEEGRRA